MNLQNSSTVPFALEKTKTEEITPDDIYRFNNSLFGKFKSDNHYSVLWNVKYPVGDYAVLTCL